MAQAATLARKKHRNKAELVGTLSTDAEVRSFDSGARVANLLVTTRLTGATERTDVVPVAVWNPDETVESACRGDHIAVKGMVQRRFWTTPNGRASKVEVVATDVQVEPASNVD